MLSLCINPAKSRKIKESFSVTNTMYRCLIYCFFAGSLEAAYSLNWGTREIWGKGGGETLALL